MKTESASGDAGEPLETAGEGGRERRARSIASELGLLFSFVAQIAIIGPGTGFGEVALIKPNTRRAATAIVEVPTELLLLERAAYDRCLKGAHSQRLAMLEKQSFLAELPLFSLWRPAQVRVGGWNERAAARACAREFFVLLKP